jgi:hypothetical protein
MCVLLALKTKKRELAHFDFRLTKLKGYEFERVLTTRNGGKFLVIGTLNKLLYPDENQVGGDWCHAVCVDTNHDTFYDGNSKCWLKLKDFPLYNQDDHGADNRFLTSIRSVYQNITVSCKGPPPSNPSVFED